MTTIDKDSLDKINHFLDENGLTEKDIQSENINFYPNGQIRIVLHYIGKRDTVSEIHLGHTDYDEDGNVIKWDSEDDRLTWVGKIGAEEYYRQQEQEYDDKESGKSVIDYLTSDFFHNKIQELKTGNHDGHKVAKDVIEAINSLKLKEWKRPSKLHPNIEMDLWKYWDDNLPLGENRKTWFYKIADKHKKSFDSIVKMEKRHRPNNFQPKR
jgi:hypothetical protein